MFFFSLPMVTVIVLVYGPVKLDRSDCHRRRPVTLLWHAPQPRQNPVASSKNRRRTTTSSSGYDTGRPRRSTETDVSLCYREIFLSSPCDAVQGDFPLRTPLSPPTDVTCYGRIIFVVVIYRVWGVVRKNRGKILSYIKKNKKKTNRYSRNNEIIINNPFLNLNRNGRLRFS